MSSLLSLPREVSGLESLGAPNGSDDFLAAAAGNKVIKAVEFCERVAATLDHPQIAVALLAMCTGGLPRHTSYEIVASPSHSVRKPKL